MEALSFIDGSLIVGLCVLLATAVWVYYEVKHLRNDGEKDEQELEKFKKEVRSKLDKLEEDTRAWQDKHEEASQPFRQAVTRIETKLDGLIERVDRAGINGKH